MSLALCWLPLRVVFQRRCRAFLWGAGGVHDRTRRGEQNRHWLGEALELLLATRAELDTLDLWRDVHNSR